jgi:hypothetical protein
MNSHFFDKASRRVARIAGSVAGSQRSLLEQGKAGWGLRFTRAVHETEQVPDADFYSVMKQVGSIRASFWKDLRRVRDNRCGSPTDDVYKPTLRYFDFPFVHGRPRESSEKQK